MIRAIFKPRFGAWSAADVAAFPLAIAIGYGFDNPLVTCAAIPALFLVSVIGGLRYEEPTDLWRGK